MSPIRTMETRFPRIGFISVGHQVVGRNDKIHPTTTDTITFHAAKTRILEPIAAAYGGEVVESPTSTEENERYFVVTDAVEIPVMVPAELDAAFSQWYEAWASSGLVRRCDGIDCVLWRKDPDKKKNEVVGELSDAIRPCICDEEGAEDRMCKPTVRLSVVPIEVAPDIPDLGVFVVRSTGFFTNSELKGDLELIRSVIGSLGAGVPLRLSVEQVRSRRGSKPKFRVGLAATPRQIMQMSAGAPKPLLEAGEASIEDEEPVGSFVLPDVGADGADDDGPASAPEAPSAPEVIELYRTPRALRR